MEGGKGGRGAGGVGGNGPPGGMWGDHRDDLGLRGCAVGMCRRRLRSWLSDNHITVMMILATIIILICNRAYDNGPVASLAWLVL
jgi:hypothetical protein